MSDVIRIKQQIKLGFAPPPAPFCLAGCLRAFPAYWESDRGHVSLGGLHQEVHPEVHQLLFGPRLLRASFVEVLVDQERLHQRVQIPARIKRKFSTTLERPECWAETRFLLPACCSAGDRQQVCLPNP